MKMLDLFSGIGGFSLAARWMVWETVQFVEWDSFCQKVLKHHWPNVPIHSDIKTFNAKYLHGAIDIISGGFPCQPYSAAGKRLGTADDRHLWPEMLRIISEVQPSWVVGENVRGLTNWNGGMVFDQVQADLEAEGYEVLPFLLPACAVNAPHRRDRIWFVAYSDKRRNPQSELQYSDLLARSVGDYREVVSHNNIRNRKEVRFQTGWKVDVDSIERNRDAADSENIGQKSSRRTRKRRTGFENGNSRNVTNPHLDIGRKRRVYSSRPEKTERHFSPCDTWPDRADWSNFPTQSPICDRNDGLSSRLVGITFPKWRNESIKALGNSIVPQVVYQIFKAIDQYNNL